MNKYSKKQLEKAVKISTSITEVMRELGITYVSGNMRSHLKQRIKDLDLDTSHFTWHKVNTGKQAKNRLKPKDVFVIDRRNGYKEKTSILKRAMIDDGINYSCKECGCSPIWREKELVLQIDHINGNPLDNRKENLRFLCPNCHSQTETYGNKKRHQEVEGC